jgi:hypothetical protein
VSTFSGGVAHCVTSALLPGTPSVTATYSGDSNYGGSTGSKTISVIVPATVDLDTSAGLMGSHSGGYSALITVTNTGTAAASNVVLTTATLGGVTGTVLPQTLGTIGPSSSVMVTVTFPGSVGLDNARSALSYAGTYSAGSFSGSVRVVLP